MAISVSQAVAPLKAVTAGDSSVAKISVGDQVIWEPTPPNDQVPYTVPFKVVGADAPPAPPSMSLVGATDTTLSVKAEGTPSESGFGTPTGYNFYANNVKKTATPDADGVYTYTGLTGGTDYVLAFTFVNGSGVESAKYGTQTRSTIEASRVLPSDTQSAIDGFVAAALTPNTKVDGCLVGIKTTNYDFYRAYGGDRTAGLTLSLDQKMRYGSVTKMYTALLVLAQIDAGTLSLDDKLGQFVDGVANGDKITIKHLLQMQSGIEDYLQQDPAVQQIYFLPSSTVNAFDPMPYIRSYAPLYEPGTQSSYSNSNYILLGKILEWVDAQHGSGRDIQTIIQQDLLTPQSLNETEWPAGIYMTAPYSRGWATNLALPTIQALLGPFAFLAAVLGYPTTPEVEWTAVNPSYGGAAGAIDGTIADLVKFGEVLGSAPMLSAEMKQLRDENFVTYLTYEPSGSNGPGWMGFGLGVIQWGVWLGWIGNLAGYHSVVFVNPTNGDVIAAIMNHMDGDPLTLFYKIVYEMFPETAELQDQIIRVDTSTSTSASYEPAVYVYHEPGDEDSNTAVPLKVPFYV